MIVLVSHFHRIYNAAAISHSTEPSHTILLAREVSAPAAEGLPDVGQIVRIIVDQQNQLIDKSVVWSPESQSDLFEDPRAHTQSDGQIRVGLTAVKGIDPYPGVVLIGPELNKLDRIKVLTELGPGKNTTPLNKPNQFCFRPEGDEHNHRLRVFEYDELMSQARVLSEIDVDPEDRPDWASWRLGTTITPIQMSERESLMIMHGIEIINSKFVYSIGLANLTEVSENQYQLSIDQTPLLTPDDFVDMDGQPLVEELHPELRRVVYICGGVWVGNGSNRSLRLFVNVGDSHTIPVDYPWDKLSKRWEKLRSAA